VLRLVEGLLESSEFRSSWTSLTRRPERRAPTGAWDRLARAVAEAAKEALSFLWKEDVEQGPQELWAWLLPPSSLPHA
jgi:hypothetical protein